MAEFRPAGHGGDADLNNGREVPCLATAKSANSQLSILLILESRGQPTSEKEGSCCWGACWGKIGGGSKTTLERDPVLMESKLVAWVYELYGSIKM